MCQLYKDDDLLMHNKTLNLKTAILGESKMGETFFSAIRKKIYRYERTWCLPCCFLCIGTSWTPQGRIHWGTGESPGHGHT